MKTISVFFGGKSTEHDVSIVTAIASVIKPLELTGEYHVLPVYIAKDGVWYSDEKFKDIALYSSGQIDDYLEKIEPLKISFDRGLVLVKKGRFGSKTETRVDVAFPATHGTYGEDGSLMGVLRMAGTPFVGCDMESSVIAMNKLLAHQVVSSAGVETHPYGSATKYDWESKREVVLDSLKHLELPLFVKPVHLGSSIGITKVAERDKLGEALDVAFSYDTVAIIEQAVPNLIEVTVPVMGPTHDPVVALVEKPLLSGDGLFDFESKYLHGNKGIKGGKKMGGKMKGSQGYSELPASIDKDLYEASVELAKRVYELTGCYGIARIDLLIDSNDRKVYFNEINPLPGGLYDHNWRASGISSVELVKRLVEYAEERAREQSSVGTTFSTNFLKQF